MAFSSFDPPANLSFVMGETERKMDMALDDIIKMSCNSAKLQCRRLQYKNGKKYAGAKSKAVVRANISAWQKNVGAKSKAVVQANITARSSSLRQKKMKQTRSLSGYGYVTAKYAVASMKAIPAAPVTAPSLRNQSRRRSGNQIPVAAFNPASSWNINMPVWNAASQIRKKPFVGGRRNLNFSLNPRPRLLHSADNVQQVHNNNPTGQYATLDSLFGRMRKQRRVSELRNHGRRFGNGGGM